MYWMLFLLIILGATVTFVIMQRYTQNKTLWITDMSATIWFAVPPDRFEVIKGIINEYNDTLPKNTGIVIVGVNFPTEEALIERLEDSMYKFSTIQVPDMIFLPEQSLEKLYRRKLVLSADKDDPKFKIFPVMASAELALINNKRYKNIQLYTEKRENFKSLEDSDLKTFAGLEKAASVYTKVQLAENIVKEEGVKPFLTINSLNRFFAISFMQLGGDCSKISENHDAFYKVWRFIVKSFLLDYAVLVDEDKQFFNGTDTVKSPVALGLYTKSNYDLAEYPQFSEDGRKVLNITKYGLEFVFKTMNDTKRSVLTFFYDWLLKEKKHIEFAVYCGCFPIIDDAVNVDMAHVEDALSMFALDINLEEKELARIKENAEIIRRVYESADAHIDYKVFSSEEIKDIVEKILDYIDACRNRLDDVIDYDNPDDDTVGVMYSRKAFDNWVNYFDL